MTPITQPGKMAARTTQKGKLRGPLKRWLAIEPRAAVTGKLMRPDGVAAVSEKPP